jgi:hypothetical protein
VQYAESRGAHSLPNDGPDANFVRDEHVTNNYRVLKAKIRRLAGVNQNTLKRLLEHLSQVAAHSEKNKMDAKNLAIVFGAVVFGEDELGKNSNILSLQSSKASGLRHLCTLSDLFMKDAVMEDLILHAGTMFEDHGSMDSSPPLPAAPSDEPQAKVGYGSSFTHVATLPPRAESNSTEGDDFMPQLPPRPDDSIHPGRRTRPLSEDRTHLPVISDTSDEDATPTFSTPPTGHPDLSEDASDPGPKLRTGSPE